jgi:hypothetical protein
VRQFRWQGGQVPSKRQKDLPLERRVSLIAQRQRGYLTSQGIQISNGSGEVRDSVASNAMNKRDKRFIGTLA